MRIWRKVGQVWLGAPWDHQGPASSSPSLIIQSVDSSHGSKKYLSQLLSCSHMRVGFKAVSKEDDVKKELLSPIRGKSLQLGPGNPLLYPFDVGHAHIVNTHTHTHKYTLWPMICKQEWVREALSLEGYAETGHLVSGAWRIGIPSSGHSQLHLPHACCETFVQKFPFCLSFLRSKFSNVY